MKNKLLKHLTIICLLIAVTLALFGCNVVTDGEPFTITNGEAVILRVGQRLPLKTEDAFGNEVTANWAYSGDSVAISVDGYVTAQKVGVTKVTGYANGHKASVKVVVYDANTEIQLNTAATQLAIGQEMTLTSVVSYAQLNGEVSYRIVSGEDATLQGNVLKGVAEGEVTVEAVLGERTSNTITVTITPTAPPVIDITSLALSADSYTVEEGQSVNLKVVTTPLAATTDVSYRILSGSELAEIEGNALTALREGEVTVEAVLGEHTSNAITITITPTLVPVRALQLSLSASSVTVGQNVTLNYTVTPSTASGNISYEIVSGQRLITLSGNTIRTKEAGNVSIRATFGGVTSNTVALTITELLTDPYVNVNVSSFYASYTPASSYRDSYYRTLHNLMSGSIAEQAQEPYIAANQPTQGGKLVRNSYAYYDDDGNTYHVVDSNGEVVFSVYRGGGYVILEEVAAYVFAFGDVPANYSTSKNTKPSSSAWGKYLRLNHSYFSGDTDSYPYEPVLPDISGCGGSLRYYELDIGTTGTDCDPKYDAKLYNNGSSITRGAARIVYSRYDANGDEIIDINEKYLFYTYNHYNDFQEYLNYYGGWGRMFGNITGGGTISSKSDCNPTPYIEVVRRDFVTNVSLTAPTAAAQSLLEAFADSAAEMLGSHSIELAPSMQYALTPSQAPSMNFSSTISQTNRRRVTAMAA